MAEIVVTNEQAVLAAEAKINILKEEFMSSVRPIALHRSNGTEPSLQELLECQRRAIAYFNYAENFVGNSGLLGAHANGLWVTGFAETCFSLLDSYLTFITLIRSYKDDLGGQGIEPSKHAYANMQRMVKEYLPAQEAAELKQKFVDNNLPTVGFDMAAVNDEEKVPRWQIVTSVCIGIVATIAVGIISFMFSSLTRWQEFILRGVLAIGLAAIAPIVPGFINLNARVRGLGAYLSIVAGGAIAIFVLIWLVNPPSVDPAKAPTPQIPVPVSK